MAQTVVPGLERRLKAHLLGDVAFDAFTRGRYASDASHYQIMPLGVVAPGSIEGAGLRSRARRREPFRSAADISKSAGLPNENTSGLRGGLGRDRGLIQNDSGLPQDIP